MHRVDYVIDEAQRQLARLNGKRPTAMDVGCGDGSISQSLARLGYRVTGLDIDPESLETAANRCRDLTAEFHLADLNRFEPSHTFDLIICSEVLEHLEHPRKVVQELSSRLSEDERLIATIPNGWCRREMLHRILRLIEDRGWGKPAYWRELLSAWGVLPRRPVLDTNPHNRHVQWFTFPAFESLVHGAGLNIDRIEHGEFLASLFPLSMVFSRSWALTSFDHSLAARLPHTLAAAWFVTAAKETNPPLPSEN